MERFTQWTENGASLILDNPQNAEEARTQLMEKFKLACNKLAELEDKMEQGTLKELPCKVGDTVYIVYAFSGILEWEVDEIVIMRKNILFRLTHKGTKDYNFALLSEKGETLFFTPEEAEKRLKELQG